MAEIDAEPIAAELMAQLWTALIELIGVAAAATLLARSVKRATAAGWSVLPSVQRQGLGYEYTVPESWRRSDTDALQALRQLAREMEPLLRELTGRVVLLRLAQIDALQRHGLFVPEKDA